MSNDNAIQDKIRCYFFGTTFKDDKLEKGRGLACFAVPDLGIIYRSLFTGNLFECQYAGLIALLRFIESNKPFFQGKSIEILSDSAVVVYQVTHRKFISRDLQAYFTAAINFKNKIPFKISWVPSGENAAISGPAEFPPISTDLNFDFEIRDKDKNMQFGKGHLRL